MRGNDPTFRMRREQLGELVNLTSRAPAQRRTAEMPAVELVDLLRRDRDLEVPPAPPAPSATPDPFDAIFPCGDMHEHADAPSACARLAGGTTVHIRRRSLFPLVLGCVAAFAGGFGLTMPLWW